MPSDPPSPTGYWLPLQECFKGLWKFLEKNIQSFSRNSGIVVHTEKQTNRQTNLTNYVAQLKFRILKYDQLRAFWTITLEAVYGYVLKGYVCYTFTSLKKTTFETWKNVLTTKALFDPKKIKTFQMSRQE